jgi:hypothetical protein
MGSAMATIKRQNNAVTQAMGGCTKYRPALCKRLKILDFSDMASG